MAFKHPFSANAIKSRIPRAICGISSLLLTAAGFSTSAHAQNTSNSVSLTLSGKKVTYSISSDWVAFKVKSSGNTATTIKGLSSQAALDNSADALYVGNNVVALRVAKSASASSKSQLSTRLANASSIERQLRVFNSAGYPVVESTDAIVNFNSGVSDDTKKNLLKKQGAILVGAVGSWAPNSYRVRVSSAKANATDVANGLLKSGSAKWAQPDLARRMEARAVPNDPLFANQWHLLNTGNNGGIAGTAGADVKASQAWDITRGAGIKICINDDAVDVDHEDLKDRFITGIGFGDAANTGPRPSLDDDNHGTSVAGLALASGNNRTGVSGVAPEAGLIAVRIPLSVGLILDSDIAQSLTWPVQQGADIVSCSWGPPKGTTDPLSDLQDQAIEYVTKQGRGGKGAILLFAAGNDNVAAQSGLDLDPRVTHIAASNRLDKKSSYSNYGSMISFAAPGGYLDGDMVTTDRMGDKGYDPSNYTVGFNGTSAACPVAAGVTALVLSANSGLTRTEVLDILKNTADKIDPGFGAYDSNGFSKYYGYGRLNAFKAVQAAVDLLGAQAKIITPAETQYDRGELTTANGTGDELAKSINVGLVQTDKDGKRTAYYNFSSGEWVTIPASNKTVGMYAAEYDDEADTWQIDLPEIGGGYYEFLAQGFTAEGVGGKVASNSFSVDSIDANVTTPTINGEYQSGGSSGNLPSAEGTTDSDASSVGVGLVKRNASGQSVYQWDFNAANQSASNWVPINSATTLTPATLAAPVGDEAAWNLDLPTVLQTGKYELRVQAFDAASHPGEMKVIPFSVVGVEEGSPINVSLTPVKAKGKVGKVIAFKGTYRHSDDYSKLTELQFRAKVSSDASSPLIQVRYDIVNNVVSIYNRSTGRWMNGYKPGTNVVVQSDVAALNVRNCKITLPKGKKATKTASISFTFAITPQLAGNYQTGIGCASRTVATENNWLNLGYLTVAASKSGNKSSIVAFDAAEVSVPKS